MKPQLKPECQSPVKRAPDLPNPKLVHGSALLPCLNDLQKAFALAHKFSQAAPSNEERARHRAVMHLIWKSCGGTNGAT
jgi:hypothetical protein